MRDKFIKSEIEEARQARAILNNQPVNSRKLWHAPGVPTVYNAIFLLAPKLGIVPIKDDVQSTITPNGQRAFVAHVIAKRGEHTRIGGASSKDADVARLLAYRNAIRHLLDGV